MANDETLSLWGGGSGEGGKEEDPLDNWSNETTHEVETKLTKEEKRKLWKKKRGKRLLRVLLRGDKKNKAIQPQVVACKRILVDHLVGNIIQWADLTPIFRLYAHLDQDIFVPAHVKYLANKFNSVVKINGGETKIPLFEYLALLSFIRLILADFIQKANVLRDTAQAKFSEQGPWGALYTPFDGEQHFEDFKNILFPLYEEAYPETTLTDAWASLYSQGKLSPENLVNYLAKISYYPQKESLLKNTLEDIDTSQTIVVGDVELALSDFVVLVRSLHISLHLFASHYRK